jgi:hypothetical protein
MDAEAANVMKRLNVVVPFEIAKQNVRTTIHDSEPYELDGALMIDTPDDGLRTFVIAIFDRRNPEMACDLRANARPLGRW